MTEGQSPEASAMARALAEHGKDSAMQEIESLKRQFNTFKSDVENLQFKDGRMALPHVETGGKTTTQGGITGDTLAVNYFANGVLQVANVYISEAPASYGPF